MKPFFVLIILICLTGCVTEHGQQRQCSKLVPPHGTNEPQNVDQAVGALLGMMSQNLVNELKAKREAEMVDYHLNLGTWIRNNWLARGSGLRLFFNRQGIYDRDAMSEIILVSLWRSIHGAPLKIDEQIDQCKTEK